MTALQDTWLEVRGEVDRQLARELGAEVQQRVSSGEFSVDELKRIADLDLTACRDSLKVSDQTLEKLRRLCQLWDIDFRPSQVTSHRRFIGPLIVAAKKITYPILRVLLRDMIRQQRDFNATAISLLVDLSNRGEKRLD